VSPTEADEVLSSIARRRVSKLESAGLELEPRFQALSNAILHLVVEGVEPASPHVGNPDFSEDMLKAFARYEQEQREAKRLSRHSPIPAAERRVGSSDGESKAFGIDSWH
jgi:hypothetical protein